MTAESATSDPYEAVLADLRARRAQIDQAITIIEMIRAGTPLPPGAIGSVIGPPSGTSSVGEGPGWLLGMTIPEAAKKLLASRHQPMRNPEIAVAFKEGGLVLNSVDPVNTIGAVLTRRFNDVGDIVKIGRGTWGLKEWYPNRSFKKDKGDNGAGKSEAPQPPEPKVPVGA